jgi:hypothetical protein
VFAIVAYALFRSKSSAYFRGAATSP